MMHSERQHNFGNMKYQSLPTQCKECEFLFACNGECPKNRFSQTAEGEPGLNYLCKGYYQFFKHVAPYMDFMKNELISLNNEQTKTLSISAGCAFCMFR